MKAVGGVYPQTAWYYQNNVAGTLVLLEEMRRAGVHQFIFSSSATVYGAHSPVPYVETTPIGGTTSPYGTSKLMVEQVLQDFARAEPQFSIIALRYFNPVGAHESGMIGEDPNGIPNNLLPYISQVAIGKLEKLGVFGGDYPTKRRYWRTRLYPCDGSGGRPPDGDGTLGKHRRVQGLQFGSRRRVFRLRDGAGL